MPFRKTLRSLIPTSLGALVLFGVLFILPASTAQSQCGSQASSCKNCHEVQGQAPVNSDGTSWHVSHAFGDFCEFCHAGNVQAMEIDAAHTGMVAPLDDAKASCSSCHPTDYLDLAEGYASVLGVTVGTGGGTSDDDGASTGSGGGGNSTGSFEASALVVDNLEMIDYNQRYAKLAQASREINLGNVLLVALIAIVALGGGSFVYWQERRLRAVSASEPTTIKEDEPQQVLTKVEDYPSEVIDLLPRVARLNPVGLRALKRLLENPADASDLLHALSRLDPDLIRRLRNLDRDSRAMLLALAGVGD